MDKLEIRIANKLREIGIPAHIKGYEYSKRAIRLCLYDRENVQYITKRLYPSIAQYFDTTSSRVERAIRHAVEVAWDRGNPDMLNDLFGYTISSNKGKPTNSEFIATIAELIKEEIYTEEAEKKHKENENG